MVAWWLIDIRTISSAGDCRAMRMTRRGRNALCACGSGKKFIRLK
ncbi:SEC-C metal-binding domain-containing protein [Bradyrhizobium sp. CCBAU 51765]|nr:hypothetical protein XH96_08100 [Bradyrhizobium sp. CCBAU 51765]